MPQFSYLGTFRAGRLRIHDRAGFDRDGHQFGDGEEVEVTVESVGEKHSRAQEKFFHGPVLKAFMSTGLHKQEAKDMLALLFIPQDIRLMDGSIVRVPGHTSALKKDAYSKFIEACIQLAAENDLYIEDSDEWLKKMRAA